MITPLYSAVGFETESEPPFPNDMQKLEHQIICLYSVIHIHELYTYVHKYIHIAKATLIRKYSTLDVQTQLLL